MDKAAVIARVASDPADRLLLARVLDQYEKAERRGIPAAEVNRAVKVLARFEKQK